MRPLVRLSLLAVACTMAGGGLRADNPVGRAHTIAYLQKLQVASGGFLPEHGKDVPTLRATSAAVRALHYLGGKVPHPEAAAKFISSCYDSKSGGFRDRPDAGAPDLFATAVGLMAVAELKLPADKFVPPGLKYLGEHASSFEDVRLAAAVQEAVDQQSPRSAAWLKQILATRNFDGSYGADAERARATGSAVAAILRLGGTVDDKTVVLTAIQEGVRPSGGWGKGAEENGADLESTYRVLRALYMLHRPPADVEAVRSFIAKCRNDDGGYGLAPGQASTAGATYFAAIGAYWLDKMARWDK